MSLQMSMTCVFVSVEHNIFFEECCHYSCAYQDYIVNRLKCILINQAFNVRNDCSIAAPRDISNISCSKHAISNVPLCLHIHTCDKRKATNKISFLYLTYIDET